MTDFHSHILPGVDDGSSSVEESCALLRMLREQGITNVIATPHFYPNRTSLDRFIEKRKAAYERLRPSLTEDMPSIRLGAEVYYYDGIRRMEGLERLCIEGSRVLLLEMPFSRWSEMTLKEVATLARSGKVQVVLAHIDRYMSYQVDGSLERLLEAGVLFQMNASYFNGMLTGRRAIRMCRDHLVHAIGSDCHNITSRPPKIGKAHELIEKRLGREFLEQMNAFTEGLLDSSK